MEIHSYSSKAGKDLIMEYLYSLPIEERIDGETVIQCLKNADFDSIKFKRWQGKIYEAYFYQHNRVFYVTADADDLYLLHACKKQKNKTEKKDKQKVIDRAKELGQLLGKKFI